MKFRKSGIYLILGCVQAAMVFGITIQMWNFVNAVLAFMLMDTWSPVDRFYIVAATLLILTMQAFWHLFMLWLNNIDYWFSKFDKLRYIEDFEEACKNDKSGKSENIGIYGENRRRKNRKIDKAA